MSAQLGGALAPLLVVPVQVRFGWRACFFVFGFLGVVWGAVWYWWFRDSPAQKAGVSEKELREVGNTAPETHRALPWGTALRARNFWATMLVAFCYVYTFYFFQSWFHTYLIKARGFSENALLLSSLPYFVAAAANCAGGFTSHVLVGRFGLKWGRRSLGVIGLGIAAPCAIAVMFTHQWLAVLILLSLVYGGITFQQPGMFAVCLDIGGEYAGATVGAMNTASQAGSLVSSLVFGYLIDRYGNYDLPFVLMAVLLFVGCYLWLTVDPTQRLAYHASPQTESQEAAS